MVPEWQKRSSRVQVREKGTPATPAMCHCGASWKATEDGTGAAESGGNTSLTATLPQDWRSFVSFLTGQSHG